MPNVPDALRQSYLATDYRVRLARGGYASIRIGYPLPQALFDLLPRPDAAWGFITAWNPWSEPQPCTVNRARQRELLAALRQQAPRAVVRSGVGAGADSGDGMRWREPSLFVAEAPPDVLEGLMRRFGQQAIVCAAGREPARLYWNT